MSSWDTEYKTNICKRDKKEKAEDNRRKRIKCDRK